MTSAVFVSGANGFVALHIIKQLLEKNYKVVGSVRSQSKGEYLETLINSPNFSYEVVPDIVEEGAFDEAVKNHPEVEYFLHTASPLITQAEDIEEEILIPAIGGTQNVLKAIKKYGPQIKRVVFTSSYCAVSAPTQSFSPDITQTEEDWSNLEYEDAKKDGINGYYGSKKYAEKAVWDFVKNESPDFKITVINPTVVLGPKAYIEEVERDKTSFSAKLFWDVYNLKQGEEPNVVKGYFIDVRDVVKAHILAFEEDHLVSKRLLLAKDKYLGKTISNIIGEHDPEYKSQHPGFDVSESEFTQTNIDSTKTKKLLNFEYKDLNTTVGDLVKQALQVSK